MPKRGSTRAWPFADPPNVAVITSKDIVSGDEWISYVSHDKDDGSWQFLPPGGPTPEDQAAVVGLATILDLDPTVGELNDLALGWCAWRETKDAPWQRARGQA